MVYRFFCFLEYLFLFLYNCFLYFAENYQDVKIQGYYLNIRQIK